MKTRLALTLALCGLGVFAVGDVYGFRGGGRGGGGARGGGGGFSRGGGMSRGGYGGMPGGGYGGMSRPPIQRTPSFSQPSMYRPQARPGTMYRPSQVPRSPSMTPRPGVVRPGAGISRPSQLPSTRPGGAVRPGEGAGISRPSQLPSTRPGAGTRPGTPPGISRPSQLPSSGLRPGTGARPPIGSARPGTGGSWAGNRPSTLPALGADGALGVGISDRMNRPGSLPGLGDRRPLPGTLPTAERRDALRDRLSGSGIADRERPSQLPARDWDQIRQDWSDRRDEIRDNWQDHRDEWQDRWQEWHDDHYPWYGGWYWGYAPAYWGWWDPLWDTYPAAATMGTTWWDANSMAYAFGCGDYANPYDADGGAIDYSEPLVAESYDQDAQPDSDAEGPPQEALDKFDQARVAFFDGNYDDALKLVDEAATLLPHDAVVHEFRSLVLFAMGRYKEAAAAIHAVLAVGPGWDWKTLGSLYPNVDIYTSQLRALEAFCGKNPKAAYAHFLLGYHRLSTGYPDAALGSFRRAGALEPNDAVTANLVQALTPRDTPGPSTDVTASGSPKPIPPADLVGSWTATGTGSAKYAMRLEKDGTFVWRFQRGSRDEQVKGVYTSEGNMVAMEPDSGGSLLAELSTKAPDQLSFKVVGGPTDATGLDFRRGKDG